MGYMNFSDEDLTLRKPSSPLYFTGRVDRAVAHSKGETPSGAKGQKKTKANGPMEAPPSELGSLLPLCHFDMTFIPDGFSSSLSGWQSPELATPQIQPEWLKRKVSHMAGSHGSWYLEGEWEEAQLV